MKRKHKPKLTDLQDHIRSDTRCWFCGQTRNTPASKYNGMCMSCYFEFLEDDIVLGVWEVA